MRYTVVASHRSEFPQPITLSRGDALVVGERYQGPEGWDDWYLCEAAGQQPGWVPAQVIGRDTQQQAFAREDYCARELDVDVGGFFVDQPMVSMPPMYGLSASGTVMLPSAF